MIRTSGLDPATSNERWQSRGLRARDRESPEATKYPKVRPTQQALLFQPPPGPLTSQLLPAKYRTNPIGSSCSIRNAIRWIREDGRAIRSRRTAKRVRRRIRKTKTPGPKRIPVDLAEIIADVPVSPIRILKLQNIPRTARYGDFQRMTPIARRGISLRVSPCVGFNRDCGAAGCWMLFADVNVGGEVAFVDDGCISWGTRAGARGARARARGTAGASCAARGARRGGGSGGCWGYWRW